VVELARRALIASALLALVHGHTLALQGTESSSQAQAAAGDVHALIRQVLADRIGAKDIPDYGLLSGAKRIPVRSDGVGFPLPLGKAALPVLEGYELRLISTAEAQAEAERTQANVHFIAIEHLKISGDIASLWIGVDFAMAPNPNAVKMCCCAQSLEYRRAKDRWIFVRWGDQVRCS
jgi:hypothetical protein